jgi:hypothetical protein
LGGEAFVHARHAAFIDVVKIDPGLDVRAIGEAVGSFCFL